MLKSETLLVGVLILLMGCNGTANTTVDHSTVDSFDLNRYLGKWYEIARFPHAFEKDLVGVTASYTLLDNGKIEVINSGYKNNLEGKFKSISGKAKLADSGNPGHLKVSFFLFFYSDYFVMELDQENYSYALVGSSSDNFLWILSREPDMDSDTYDMLVEKARDRGYDISRLEKVPQPEE